MRFLHSFVTPLVLLAAGAAQAASSWSFEDATVQVNAKKAAGTKEKYVALIPQCVHTTPTYTKNRTKLLSFYFNCLGLANEGWKATMRVQWQLTRTSQVL